MNKEFRQYLLSKHLEKEKEKARRLQKSQYEISRFKNTQINKIPDMKASYQKVCQSKITLNQDYERLTNSNFKYKL